MHTMPRVIFFGDSITELGEKKGGYVSLVRDSLGNECEVIGAGISGNKVTDLHRRLKKDVLSKNPNVVVIYIGINDVWHFQLHGEYSGTTKEIYKKILREIVSDIQSSGAAVVLCTPSVIGEKFDGTNSMDIMLNEYCDISRVIAKENKTILLDLRKRFLAFLKEYNSANSESGILTTDGVHLNGEGNRFVAEQMLKTLKEMKLFSQ